MGKRDASLPEIYKIAYEKGISSFDLPWIPEEDHWKYNTTRYGEPYEEEISVCHTFVCKVMKHAGVFDKFGVNFNCNEFSLFDVTKLKIYDSNFKRP